ncbi:adenine-specific DNA methylase [Spirosoma oryzae]|uniref:Adenine-specific DNA methylase n=1 Tax=Spirosoma oryzae TaxID=1469603 RepID=A0A2T0RME9_9BACT|nr:DUF1156 domain-containing protein [Spirosoma oryzae]PRY22293.1 adenine-specific DNA methylase [Spirosoma oryzae]
MSNPYKYLIEVAMPVREVSAESVRDKSIRHGHISTLHLWWARRPLPVCRAVVFASLVPDPDDANCPALFGEAVDALLTAKLGAPDHYKPYDDIPYTSVEDRVADTRRNRLLTFIGKFSDTFIANEKAGKSTASGQQISEHSLIKWDNKANETILGIARKLIWVAHNVATTGSGGVNALIADFDRHYQAIKDAERALYQTPDRHLDAPDSKQKTDNLQKAIDAFLDRMPRVFDPFAGGGAIPLEAARLGCRTYGNDINPVAHIIQRGSLEFPQRYGKPIIYSKAEFKKLYGADTYLTMEQNGQVKQDGTVHLKNRLSHDVAFYAKRLLREAEAAVGQYYPTVNGRKPIAYYWARVGTCANPSCRAEVPLLKQFYLCNKPGKQVYLKPIITGQQINFELKQGRFDEEGWMSRGNMKCPCCGNTTDVNTLKKQFLNGTAKEKMLAVIEDGDKGKVYRQPVEQELAMVATIPASVENNRPTEEMPVKYTQALPSCTWGLNRWGDMFSTRQLLTLQTLVDCLTKLKQEWGGNNFIPDLSDYQRAVVTYLSIWIDRIAIANTSFGIWHTGRETLERIMGRQAIPMVFDYPDSNPFCDSTGSAANQLDWITRYLEDESKSPFAVELKNASSGDVHQFEPKYLNAVVTDPPYYDAIAYADLSDFFYVWLKRTLGDVFPLSFALPQTPKSDECTAMKHHHSGNVAQAKQHFENKLQQIFEAIEQQTSGVVSIMFAHQSTSAWTTLCRSILGSKMNLTGSWALDTEMSGALKTDKAFLESSVTVSCRPTEQVGIGDFREVKRDIERAVRDEVRTLTALGFRGADLLTACFGQAVSVFGQYRLVEKSNGDEVTVAELLELARESAFNAIVSDIRTDDYTRFYLAWLQLNGFTEADHDDVRRVVQVGLSVNVTDIEAHRLLIQNGNRQTLATVNDRTRLSNRLGYDTADPMIDKLHQAMFRWAGTDRRSLVQYIAQTAPTPEDSFWRVLASLFELLPKGSEDHRAAEGLLSGRDSLIREARAIGQQPATADANQLGLGF